MTKLGAVADCHLGNHKRFGGQVVAGINARGQLALDAFKRAVEAAQDAHVRALIVLGDLFDTSHPEPQLIAAVQEIVKDIQLVVLMGNHDQVSSEPGDHALGPLTPVATVIEKPQILQLDEVELWAVPFRPGRATDWLPQVMAELQGSTSKGRQPRSVRVLALHLGLLDDSTAPWLLESHDAVPAKLVGELCDQYDIDTVLAGNWHDRKQWTLGPERGSILQVGTLCPTGWDNPGTEGFGGLAILDVDFSKGGIHEDLGLEVKEIPGPRFIKVEKPDEWTMRLLDMKEQGQKVFARVIAPPEFMSTARAWFEAEKKAGTIVDGEVEPEGTEERIAAITAAHSARSAETLDEATANFVRDMPLPDGVDRAAVLARVKRFLGGA
jgi:hypothetical protein